MDFINCGSQADPNNRKGEESDTYGFGDYDEEEEKSKEYLDNEEKLER